MNQELNAASFERFLSERGFRPSRPLHSRHHLPPISISPFYQPPIPPSHSSPPASLTFTAQQAHPRPSSSSPSRPVWQVPPSQQALTIRDHAEDAGARHSTSSGSNSGSPLPARRRKPRASSGVVKRSASKPPEFQCEYCKMVFGRKHHKERHVDNLHRRSTGPTCKLCGISFHQKPNLFRHMQLVHAVLPYQCGICGSGFSRRMALKKHEQIRHAPKMGGAYEPH